MFHVAFLPLLTSLSSYFNSICIDLSPTSEWKHAYEGIVCGVPLKQSEFKAHLITTGLIHLIVVSGSHLLFLGAFCEKFCKKKFVAMMILVFFTLLTNLQPPTVRALISIFLDWFCKKHFLFWTKSQHVFVSGIITLLCFPNWITSISFVMSWSASFALASNRFHSRRVRHHLWIFLILFPIFAPLSPLNPISILTNLTFAPMIGAILFPISILGFISGVTKYTDFLWTAFDFAIQKVAVIAPDSIRPISIPLYVLWGYLFSLHIFSHVISVTKRQQPNA
ncbi:MAG: hypothetical protein A4S09_07705 [Proteobacteria bacterium SG_bin7]|nr:MAG: hypothetical protein A4S09_07705 [Proteobacteria bacterium SG_bin7]